MCDESRDANITQRTEAELNALGLEHPDHYSIKTIRQVTGK
jgi:hypothetical protein